MTLIDALVDTPIPEETDILGTVYQSLLEEGEKNLRGTYYTTAKVAQEMVGQYDLGHQKTFLDPCCGSGIFLMSLCNADPHRIYGFDNDPVAVMIAKANLMLRYAEKDFYPNIFCTDFLSENVGTGLFAEYSQTFDVIATNPPWGAVRKDKVVGSTIESNETATLFLEKAFSLLNDEGRLNFLMPSSILNVKTHKDLRLFLLTQGNLSKIKVFNELFSGVTTTYASIEHVKSLNAETFAFEENGKSTTIAKATIYESANLVLGAIDKTDQEILQKIRSLGNNTLKDSRWALGIVTGDNSRHLHKERETGDEVIYTGKEIAPFTLKTARYFIRYDRSSYQQVASEDIYRAPEKLVYKFISKKLTFALDTSRSLFLNSGNILIPNVPNMSTKTVMAFLNSSVFQYLYIKLFDEIKILKGNLLQLPFPAIDRAVDRRIETLVDDILNGIPGAESNLAAYLQNLYRLTDDEMARIRQVADHAEQ
ncbi:MAG: N-6 DNA methylase [Sutterellaceae bacterium]|nr:N-6 DNA methylase [Sutterellaceae bacterium]